MADRIEYDLAIVGGGLVGGSLACALRDLGLRIALIEAVAPTAPAQPSFDARVIALALGSQRIFAGMGLWPAIASAAEPIRRVHVSERGGCGMTRIDCRDEGVEALGYAVTAERLGAAIRAGLATLPELDLLRPARPLGLRVEADRVHLEIDSEGRSRRLAARLLVAADGGASMVRKRLGIGLRERDYGQQALLATVAAERPQPGTAFERFTDSGPLAALPLAEGRYAIVWTVRDEQADALRNLDDQAFAMALRERFGDRLGVLSAPGPRLAYPLRLRLARELTRPRALLIGNAAHTLHPVAGQGFNLGLRDVAELADLLADARRTGGDPGASAVLRGYRERRRFDQARVALATDGLVRLFACPGPAARLGRHLGLLALDALPPARHRLARAFMGIDGRLPRLARGLPARAGPPADAIMLHARHAEVDG